MAIDYSIRVGIDSTVADAVKIELQRKIAQILEDNTFTVAHNAAYVEGTGATDQTEYTVTA